MIENLYHLLALQRNSQNALQATQNNDLQAAEAFLRTSFKNLNSLQAHTLKPSEAELLSAAQKSHQALNKLSKNNINHSGGLYLLSNSLIEKLQSIKT